MTLYLSGTVENDETGETELGGGLQKIIVFVSPPFCFSPHISVGRIKNLKIFILTHVLDSPLQHLSRSEGYSQE